MGSSEWQQTLVAQGAPIEGPAERRRHRRQRGGPALHEVLQPASDPLILRCLQVCMKVEGQQRGGWGGTRGRPGGPTARQGAARDWLRDSDRAVAASLACSPEPCLQAAGNRAGLLVCSCLQAGHLCIKASQHASGACACGSCCASACSSSCPPAQPLGVSSCIEQCTGCSPCLARHTAGGAGCREQRRRRQPQAGAGALCRARLAQAGGRGGGGDSVAANRLSAALGHAARGDCPGSRGPMHL